jgi:glycosyltransferase involved in cell wall biosynthesis
MPSVSVVIPTYNRKDTLEETLQSVYNQTFRDFEIIVVDHGSTDGTEEWLQTNHAGKIRVIKLPYCPLPGCPRNAGIKAALGTYVAFLDSDDLWLPRKLEKQIAALEKDARLGWSYGNAERFGPGVKKGTPEVGQWQLHSGRVFEKLMMENFVPSCTVVVRKSCFETTGVFDLSPELRSSEDYELWLRLAARYDVVAMKEVIARYRVSESQMSSDQTKRTGPETFALELVNKKLALDKKIFDRAMAAAYLRQFRYSIMAGSANALDSLRSALRRNPCRLRALLYRTGFAIGGAGLIRGLIRVEWFVKRNST